MTKEIIYTDKAPKPIGPYSQATKIGDLLFLSGQIAIKPETGALEMNDIETETKQVMKNIQAILSESGLTFNHIVKSSIFLSDMNSFNKVNEVYGSYFNGTEPPARETVEVSHLPKSVNVEISVIAHY